MLVCTNFGGHCFQYAIVEQSKRVLRLLRVLRVLESWLSVLLSFILVVY